MSKLGEGANSKVIMATSVQSRKNYAIKVHLSYDPKLGESIAQEVKVLQTVDHPNIIKIRDFLPVSKIEKLEADGSLSLTTEVYFVVILELADKHELINHLMAAGPLEEKLAKVYFYKLSSALKLLKDQGIAHRDIKPDNIVFDKHFEVKLIDFGFASHWGKYEDGMLRTRLGTDQYLAPEMRLGTAYDGHKSDIFSLGATLFTSVIGVPPFHSSRNEDCYFAAIKKGQWQSLWNTYEDFSSVRPEASFKALIQRMLEPDPEKRASVEEVLESEWLTGGEVPSVEEIKRVMKAKVDKVVESKLERRKQQY